MDLSHIKEKFIEETEALLTRLDSTILNLEKDPQNTFCLREAFRITHTIKGSAGMVGFDHVVDIAHEIESLYDMAISKSLKVTPSFIELTLISADHIRTLIADQEHIGDNTIKVHELLKEHINRIKKSIDDSPGKPESQHIQGVSTWNILFYPNDKLVGSNINLVLIFQELFAQGHHYIVNQPFNSNEEQYWSIFLITSKSLHEIQQILKSVISYCKITRVADYDIFNSVQIKQRVQYVEKQKVLHEEKEIEDIITQNFISEDQSLINIHNLKESYINLINTKKSSSINVDIAKLETMMNLVNELNIAKSSLGIALQEKNLFAANKAAVNIDELSKLFSQNAQSIRMVSFAEIIPKFNRMIRDTAKELGKKIEFLATGDEIEIERHIIDEITLPLMHIIRNCIDHGIEAPSQRLSAGKPEIGNIRFEVNKSETSVIITIKDDGGGIDAEYIYRKAIEQGYIKEDTKLSPKEINNLIFLPGFTTAKKLTKISGRGMGMDIVLQKIQEINGEISILSAKGEGTSFIIKLHEAIPVANASIQPG